MNLMMINRNMMVKIIKKMKTISTVDAKKLAKNNYINFLMTR